MRKPVILLSIVILLTIGLVAFWSIRAGHITPSSTVSNQDITNSAAQTTAETFPPPVRAHSGLINKPAPSVLQINATDTAVLQKRMDNWLQARGCNPWTFASGWHQTESTLRLRVINDSLTAADILGIKLIYDPKRDGRPEAKKILWQAAMQGSTCALAGYYLYWQHFSRETRKVVQVPGSGRLTVRYTPKVPVSIDAKRRQILDAYAWDLVSQMRTGIVPPLISFAYTQQIELDDHYTFSPKPSEYAYTCQRATALYDNLLAQREAAGYGLFDNSPPPMSNPVIGNPMETGLHCKHWPVPKPRCEPAEFHAVERTGEIHPFKGWVCAASDVNSSGADE